MSAAKVKLTAAQRAKVRSLMADEGEPRAAAVAWVLAFEPAHARGCNCEECGSAECDAHEAAAEYRREMGRSE